MLRPKLVLLLTEILQNSVLKKHDVFHTFAIPDIMWYEPLYNTHSGHFLLPDMLQSRDIRSANVLIYCMTPHSVISSLFSSDSGRMWNKVHCLVTGFNLKSKHLLGNWRVKGVKMHMQKFVYWYLQIWVSVSDLVLGITHLFPHNELVHLPYIAVATNTRAD